MADREAKYPITMEELRKSCPLVKVEVVANGSGGDVLIGRQDGEIRVRVECKKVTKGAVEKFQESYYRAVKIGAIRKPPVLEIPSPSPASSADNVVAIDADRNAATDAIPEEEEPSL